MRVLLISDINDLTNRQEDLKRAAIEASTGGEPKDDPVTMKIALKV